MCVDTLTLASSRIGSDLFRWKFVTNNAFDTPHDYSTADAGLVDGLDNLLALARPGSPDLAAAVGRITQLYAVLRYGPDTPPAQLAKLRQLVQRFTPGRRRPDAP